MCHKGLNKEMQNCKDELFSKQVLSRLSFETQTHEVGMMSNRKSAHYGEVKNL